MKLTKRSEVNPDSGKVESLFSHKRTRAWNATLDFDGKTYRNLGWVPNRELRKAITNFKVNGYVLLRTVKHKKDEGVGNITHIFGRKRK